MSSWIADSADYVRVLFGSPPEYEVADIPAEILQLQLELASLRQQRQQHRAQLRRDLVAPASHSGANHGSQVVNAPVSAVYNEVAIKDRKERIQRLDNQIARRIRRIKFLRLRSRRHWYLVGLFLFLILLYSFLGGAAVYRQLYGRPTPPSSSSSSNP